MLSSVGKSSISGDLSLFSDILVDRVRNFAGLDAQSGFDNPDWNRGSGDPLRALLYYQNFEHTVLVQSGVNTWTEISSVSLWEARDLTVYRFLPGFTGPSIAMSQIWLRTLPIYAGCFLVQRVVSF